MTCSSAFDDFPQLHILEMAPVGCCWHEHKMTGLKHNVTSMCLVGDSVWFGDNLGFVHAYSADAGCNKLFTYKMEPDEMEDAAPVRSIHYLSAISRACVAMHNGRMFLCASDVVPSASEGCEGTFLITELGSATCIHSVTSITKSDSSSLVEIWCGESHGAISVFTLRDGIVTSQEVINHNDPVVENVEVFQVRKYFNFSPLSLPPFLFSHSFSPSPSVVTDPGIGNQRSDSLALFCGRKKIRIFKARIRIFVAR
jgi:hypothetical protein